MNIHPSVVKVLERYGGITNKHFGLSPEIFTNLKDYPHKAILYIHYNSTDKGFGYQLIRYISYCITKSQPFDDNEWVNNSW